MTCRPGHSPRHPDFGPGNEANLRHGVWSAGRAERVGAEVEAIAQQVAERYPWTAAYMDERVAYARALVDERDIRNYLDAVGPLDEDQRERPAVRTLERFKAHASRSRAVLGITPTAHARLLVMVAEVVRLNPDRGGPLEASLGTLLAEGRAALERGSQRHGEPA